MSGASYIDQELETQVAVTISKSTPFFKKTKFISFLLYLQKKKKLISVLHT
jgi:hypothetical protein